MGDPLFKDFIGWYLCFPLSSGLEWHPLLFGSFLIWLNICTKEYSHIFPCWEVIDLPKVWLLANLKSILPGDAFIFFMLKLDLVLHAFLIRTPAEGLVLKVPYSCLFLSNYRTKGSFIVPQFWLHIRAIKVVQIPIQVLSGLKLLQLDDTFFWCKSAYLWHCRRKMRLFRY